MSIVSPLYILRGTAVALLLCLTAPWAGAAELRGGGTARAVKVIDGDTLVLDDGREVRLVGIQAPKLPLGRTNFPAWPLAEESKRALEQVAGGKSLGLRYGGREIDRNNRALAHLYVEGHAGDNAARWVQGEMLRRGLARVYTFADNRALAAELLAAERVAREGRRGIWALPYYRVRDAVADATELSKSADTFQVVEGRVTGTGARDGRTYLNFGADYREDFTIAIPSGARAAFRAAGLQPASLVGQQVRVRGWLKRLNGPLIDVTHPEQIEVLP